MFPFMTPKKQTYAEKLKDARWQKKRLELFNGASWTCEECSRQMPADGLQVHHVLYLPGVDPWDYPSYLLRVLCECDHQKRQAVENEFFCKVAQAIQWKTIEELKLMPVWWMFETSPFYPKD